MDAKGDIVQALDYCKNLFAISPQLLVLATVMGEYLGHLILSEETIEVERVLALSAGASGHHDLHAMEYRLGKASYSLMVAETGCIVYAKLDEDRVLSLMFKDATETTLSSILFDLPKAIEYLINLEL